MRLRSITPAVLALALGACASAGTPATPRADREVVTAEQMLASNFTDVYQALQALRPHWLTARGTSGLGPQAEVQVLYDDTRLGGVNALKGISTRNVSYVRHYSSNEAMTRFGREYSQGVILVSTHPVQGGP